MKAFLGQPLCGECLAPMRKVVLGVGIGYVYCGNPQCVEYDNRYGIPSVEMKPYPPR